MKARRSRKAQKLIFNNPKNARKIMLELSNNTNKVADHDPILIDLEDRIIEIKQIY